MKANLPLLLLAILLGSTGLAQSHGISWRLVEDAITIEVTYDGGEPIADADVEITPPGHHVPTLHLATDPHGRFTFLPAQPGLWLIRVDDGMGHAETFELVSDGMNHALSAPRGLSSRTLALIAGLAVIASLAVLSALAVNLASRRTGHGNEKGA
ncbi:MAG TPA: hypothetical protein PKE55_10540 [Kiritimatiellia bacterium]|nr:hypothetical protein [Kiritimatiellia bacterium]